MSQRTEVPRGFRGLLRISDRRWARIALDMFGIWQTRVTSKWSVVLSFPLNPGNLQNSQANTHSNKQAIKEAIMQANKQSCKQACKQTNKRACKQASKQASKRPSDQATKQTSSIQASKHASKQVHRSTRTHKHGQPQTRR